ncbi:MAG: sigma-70 family RNA polymerase sigma factor [Lachnospiraceae bacterium]|nr:sigma-70 family RNA polymerase sigma factor [Lachnospiraceae bacterium]MBR4994358.1 sigma-70 family RNA polymerase sigma factor [Lachnospiraceae bacterium]MBR5944972.1 sigma-70 family RNA polymerase sigma factor [Lachnospiraceae bacterium]
MNTPDSDAKLYIRYLNKGDDEAIGELYERYSKSLVLFLYGMVSNMEDAEELMMDTFSILSSRTVRYVEKKESGFKTWLFSIAKNRARMFLRKHKTILSLSMVSEDSSELGETLQSDDPEPEEQLIADESKKNLYEALESLSDEYRQVLYLTYFEDMRPADISRIMKKTTKQVYNLTSRGKEALKEALERMGYNNPWMY